MQFDVWKSEGSLYADGWVDARGRATPGRGLLSTSRTARLWFRSTAFGDDKDRVVRRSNGEYTYFGSDIGYVLREVGRGFDELVYIWGADHHGTVARVRNAAQAMGLDRAAVAMLLIAWVRFVRDGQEVSMSKRAGEFITLDELLDEIGVDAARWFFAARGRTSGHRLRHRAGEASSRPENPVYYVQYAHARIASHPAQGGRDRALARGDARRVAWATMRSPWAWPRSSCDCRRSCEDAAAARGDPGA